jgi:hypothetical protein
MGLFVDYHSILLFLTNSVYVSTLEKFQNMKFNEKSLVVSAVIHEDGRKYRNHENNNRCFPPSSVRFWVSRPINHVFFNDLVCLLTKVTLSKRRNSRTQRRSVIG